MNNQLDGEKSKENTHFENGVQEFADGGDIRGFQMLSIASKKE